MAATNVSVEQLAAAEPTPLATPLVAGSASYIVDRSIQQSVTNAEIIVIGQVTRLGEVVNTDRDTQDHTKPASNTFGVGQTYNVQVQQYLKGSGENNLTILEGEGAIQSPSELVTQSDIERAKISYGAQPLTPGKTYLMLLSKQPDYFGGNYYGGQGNPWRFVLQEDGSYILEASRDVLFQLSTSYRADVKGSLVDYIKQSVAADTAAKPIP